MPAVDALSQAETGGTPILSYSLEVDDGLGGSFVPLSGFETDSLSLNHLVKRD